MPRLVDRDQRREELLARCFELFAREGYAGLTMRRIGKELGVSTGTLYHYFAGKPELFAQMFQWIRTQDIRALAEFAPPGLPLARRLELLQDFVVQHAASMSHALRIALEFHREAPDAAGRALLRETLDDYRGAIAQQLDLEDPQVISAIMSFILGILTQHTLDPERVDVRAQVKLVELALVGR